MSSLLRRGCPPCGLPLGLERLPPFRSARARRVTGQASNPEPEAALSDTPVVLVSEHLSKENPEGSTPVLGMGCEVAFCCRIHILAVSVILNHRDLRGPDFGQDRRFRF